MIIDKNLPPSKSDIDKFIASIEFELPVGYIKFMQESNGADISFENSYLILWPITDLISLNQEYGIEEFASDYFLIGSDGGDTTYAISRKSSNIYKMPFIGMSNEEAVLVSNNFNEFLDKLDE